MSLKLHDFSQFIANIYIRSRELEADALARWAVWQLSELIGFDSAWYGWAQLSSGTPKIFAHAGLNLPADYFSFWSTIAEQDLLAQDCVLHPEAVAVYERNANRQTDGMVALSERYHLNKLASALHWRSGRASSFYLSCYRCGGHARSYSEQDKEFLHCAIQHISQAMYLSAREQSCHAGQEREAMIYVNAEGMGILGLGIMREKLGNFWPEWTGDNLPEKLQPLVRQPGQHVLVDHDLVVVSMPQPEVFSGLHKLILRRMNRMDGLTHREHEVAQQLALGRSHKEVARQLGISPNTVRNQTQALYSKLGVSKRAELARLFGQA